MPALIASLLVLLLLWGFRMQVHALPLTPPSSFVAVPLAVAGSQDDNAGSMFARSSLLLTIGKDDQVLIRRAEVTEQQHSPARSSPVATTSTPHPTIDQPRPSGKDTYVDPESLTKSPSKAHAHSSPSSHRHGSPHLAPSPEKKDDLPARRINHFSEYDWKKGNLLSRYGLAAVHKLEKEESREHFGPHPDTKADASMLHQFGSPPHQTFSAYDHPGYSSTPHPHPPKTSHGKDKNKNKKRPGVDPNRRNHHAGYHGSISSNRRTDTIDPYPFGIGYGPGYNIGGSSSPDHGSPTLEHGGGSGISNFFAGLMQQQFPSSTGTAGSANTNTASQQGTATNSDSQSGICPGIGCLDFYNLKDHTNNNDGPFPTRESCLTGVTGGLTAGLDAVTGCLGVVGKGIKSCLCCCCEDGGCCSDGCCSDGCCDTSGGGGDCCSGLCNT